MALTMLILTTILPFHFIDEKTEAGRLSSLLKPTASKE